MKTQTCGRDMLNIAGLALSNCNITAGSVSRDCRGAGTAESILDVSGPPSVPPGPPSERSSWLATGYAPGSEPVARYVLRCLQLASVDRVIREARRLEPDTSRGEVLQQLEVAGRDVVWLGRAIVCTAEVAT